MIEEEKIVWHSRTTPDGRELVTFGTAAWPIECWGVWAYKEDHDLRSVIPWHWHDEMELNLVIKGEVDMMADGKCWRMKPGQGIFIAPGVMHRTARVDVEEGQYTSVVFRADLVGGASGSVFWQNYVAPLCFDETRSIPLFGQTEWEKEIAAQIARIAKVWPDKQTGYEMTVRDALTHCLFLLSQNCVKDAPTPSARELRDAERIKTMVGFVRDHFADNITTEQIAQSASVSVSECLRCFRHMMDLTPKTYLRQHRLRHAVQLLNRTDLSVAQIGTDCGFDDMSYFARVFRSEYGCTPTAWREQHRNETVPDV